MSQMSNDFAERAQALESSVEDSTNTDASLDSSGEVTSDYTGGNTPQGNTGTSSEIKVSPAWQEVLDLLPEEFHGAVTPKLSKWDSNFSEVQQKYSPYKDLVEHSVPMAHIEEAMQLRHLYQTNPIGVMNYIAQMQGVNLTGPDEEEQDEPEEFDPNYQELDLENHPQFQQLRQQAEFSSRVIQENLRIQQERDMDAEIQQEVEAVKQRFPNADIELVVNTALGFAQRNNSVADLMQAAEYLDSKMPRARVSDSAPPVLSGNRGLPTSQVNPGAMSSNDRTKLVADLIAHQVSQG